MDFKSGKTTTLGTIMDREHLSNSNPTLFIPRRGNKIMQIASKKPKDEHDEMTT